MSQDSPRPATVAVGIVAQLQRLTEATVGNDAAAVEDALRVLSHPIREVPKRQSVPYVEQMRVYRRDCWTCRYCGTRTIPSPVLQLLSVLYPEDLPFHPNWRSGQVHPAYLLISTSLDHVIPGARDGAWRDRDNLVTACWPCNSAKADFLLEEIGRTVLPIEAVQGDWDGLTHAYPYLWEKAGQPQANASWRTALLNGGTAEEQPL